MLLRYSIVVEKANGNYSAYCPDIPGCIAAGNTVEETIQRLKEAITFHFEGLREDKLPIPEPKTKVDYIEVAA